MLLYILHNRIFFLCYFKCYWKYHKRKIFAVFHPFYFWFQFLFLLFMKYLRCQKSSKLYNKPQQLKLYNELEKVRLLVIERPNLNEVSYRISVLKIGLAKKYNRVLIKNIYFVVLQNCIFWYWQTVWGKMNFYLFDYTFFAFILFWYCKTCKMKIVVFIFSKFRERSHLFLFEKQKS